MVIIVFFFLNVSLTKFYKAVYYVVLMIDFNRNNLDKASSPYLQQHKDNPIHWQEWNSEVLEYAKKNNKLIFVSVGYATCHWCHVMAAEAFSNKEIADYLNKHFVAIKVDREQRPDIDRYLMSFIQTTQGQGGWPLNAILTPDRKPFLAVTYLPVVRKHGMPSFLDVLNRAKDGYEKNKEKIQLYVPLPERVESIEEKDLIKMILANFDKDGGGFGYGVKFPPHNTLLFLLSYFEKTKNKEVKEMIEKTLDKMATHGLHDHLQGGFYRYCVDNAWTIPHFEKMLYDQAMLLWGYSAAYKVLGKEEYKTIIEKIIACLEETFNDNGLFYSAHDADTDHEEGKTYLWTLGEIKAILTVEEFDKFTKLYNVTEHGNFEGKNHLIKKENKFLSQIEQKLLQERKKRKQPFTDKKFVTSWNALVGISLLIAYRCTGNDKVKEKAITLFNKLLEKHYVDGKLFHSSLGKTIQKNEFLEDYASMLLFATYMYEEGEADKKLIEELFKKLKEFYKEQWFENKKTDLMEIPAQAYDHPAPSSVSLAEFAILRTQIILEENYVPGKYKQPLSYDFFNLMIFVKNGDFHIIHSPERIEWGKLPLNSIQIPSKTIDDCYAQKCNKFESVEGLIKSLS